MMMNYEMFKEAVVETNTARNNVIFSLVNTKENSLLLANVPHRDFMDLSIVYYLVILDGDNVVGRTIVDKKLANNIGMSEEMLYECAYENTRRLLPPNIKSMDEIMAEIFGDDEMVMLKNEIITPKYGLWVISNESNSYGASSMLYDDVLDSIAEKLESSYYILPSSIHEFIAISDKCGSPSELGDMVKEVNISQVEVEERLSNQIYHYDQDNRKLSEITDKHLHE